VTTSKRSLAPVVRSIHTLSQAGARSPRWVAGFAMALYALSAPPSAQAQSVGAIPAALAAGAVTTPGSLPSAIAAAILWGKYPEVWLYVQAERRFVRHYMINGVPRRAELVDAQGTPNMVVPSVDVPQAPSKAMPEAVAPRGMLAKATPTRAVVVSPVGASARTTSGGVAAPRRSNPPSPPTVLRNVRSR
jgi:hypothetical protein